MRKRVARKIGKRITAGASCPRRNGCGYTEGTRARACALLYPRAQLPRIEHFGPSSFNECYAIFKQMNDLLTWAALR